MNANPTITLPHLSRAFYMEPIALEEGTMLSVHAWLWPRVTGQIESPLVISAAAAGSNSIIPEWSPHTRRTMLGPTRSENGNIIDPRYYWSVDDRPDIAVLPVSGMIMKGAGFFQEACMGAVSTERISYAVQQVAAAKEVKNVVFDVNSPGGVVTGVNELATQVRDLAAMRGKNVYVFADQMVASAAYWLASQADMIVTTPSAQVGSIGTYLAFLNEKVKMQTQGVNLELFKSGTHKGLGLPGGDITQENRAYLQARVDDLNTQFVAAVKAGRPKISAGGVTHAAMYSGVSTVAGASSINHGLADGIVANWDEFLKMI